MKLSTFLTDLKNNSAIVSQLGNLNLSLDELITEATNLEARSAEQLGTILKPIPKDYGLFAIDAKGNINWKNNKVKLEKRASYNRFQLIADDKYIYGFKDNYLKIIDFNGNDIHIAYPSNPTDYYNYIDKSADKIYCANNYYVAILDANTFNAQPKIDARATLFNNKKIVGFVYDELFDKLIFTTEDGIYVVEPDLSGATKIAEWGEEMYHNSISVYNIRWFDKTKREIIGNSSNRIVIFKLLDNGSEITGIQITKMFDFGYAAFYEEVGGYYPPAITYFAVGENSLFIAINAGKIFKLNKNNFDIEGVIGTFVTDKYNDIDDDILTLNSSIGLLPVGEYLYINDRNVGSLSKISIDLFTKEFDISYEKPNFKVKDVIFADTKFEILDDEILVKFDGCDFVSFKYLPKVAAIGD